MLPVKVIPEVHCAHGGMVAGTMLLEYMEEKHYACWQLSSRNASGKALVRTQHHLTMFGAAARACRWGPQRQLAAVQQAGTWDHVQGARPLLKCQRDARGTGNTSRA